MTAKMAKLTPTQVLREQIQTTQLLLAKSQAEAGELKALLAQARSDVSEARKAFERLHDVRSSILICKSNTAATLDRMTEVAKLFDRMLAP
jgi:hypothetical protein